MASLWGRNNINVLVLPCVFCDLCSSWCCPLSASSLAPCWSPGNWCSLVCISCWASPTLAYTCTVGLLWGLSITSLQSLPQQVSFSPVLVKHQFVLIRISLCQVNHKFLTIFALSLRACRNFYDIRVQGQSWEFPVKLIYPDIFFGYCETNGHHYYNPTMLFWDHKLRQCLSRFPKERVI